MYKMVLQRVRYDIGKKDLLIKIEVYYRNGPFKKTGIKKRMEMWEDIFGSLSDSDNIDYAINVYYHTLRTYRHENNISEAYDTKVISGAIGPIEMIDLNKLLP